MNCPRCQNTVLDERQRDGVTVDVCPVCRGLWLDRGELEKVIAQATREFEELAQGGEANAARGTRHHSDDDEYRRDPRKKRSWFESLGELFD